METIIERYERHCYAEKALQTTEPLSQGNLSLEYGKLKNKVESLQKSQSHLMGEKLDSLSLKELQQLEQQLETGLKQIRSQRSQMLHNSIAELQRTEKSLLENNSFLENKISEIQKVRTMTQHTDWKNQRQAHASSSPPQFINDLPNLNLGRYSISNEEEDAAPPLVRMNSNSLPPWMLQAST